MDGVVIVLSLFAVGCVTGLGVQGRKLLQLADSMDKNRKVLQDLNDSEN